MFDGCFFDRLAAAGALTVSKPQHSGADYLPVIYEDSPALTAFSASLLCSYNRLTAKSGTFSSFGDANGTRKDMYRWYQQLNQGKTTDLPIPDSLALPEFRQKLADSYILAINGGTPEPEYTEIFRYLGYMKGAAPSVPIYHAAQKFETVGKLDGLTAELVFDQISEALTAVSSAPALTAAQHSVLVPDIANEIYHLLFGQINEELVRGGLVAAPEYCPGEGRYLRCFEIN